MGLHQIKEELLKHANEEAKKITVEAQQKAAEIIAVEKEKLHDLEDAMQKQGEKELDLLEKRELAANALEMKKYLYEKKTELMTETFKAAKQEMQNLPKKEKTVMINALLKKAEKELTIATIYCNQNDKELIKGYAIITDTAITAGIIVENKEKTVRIDYTIDSFMKDVEDKKLQEVAAVLFD